MNLKALTLGTILSASPFAPNNLAAQTIYRPISTGRIMTSAPNALDSALAETASETRSSLPLSPYTRFDRVGTNLYRTDSIEHHKPHIQHPKHEKHLPLEFYQFRPSFDNRNIPMQEYEALIHTPPLRKHGLLHHVELEFGLMISTEAHEHRTRSYEHATHGATYSLNRSPGVVVGVKFQ